MASGASDWASAPVTPRSAPSTPSRRASRPASQSASGGAPAKRRRVRAAATVRRLWLRTRWTSLVETEAFGGVATAAGASQAPGSVAPSSARPLDPKEEVDRLREIVAGLQYEVLEKPNTKDEAVFAKPDTVDKAVFVNPGTPLSAKPDTVDKAVFVNPGTPLSAKPDMVDKAVFVCSGKPLSVPHLGSGLLGDGPFAALAGGLWGSAVEVVDRRLSAAAKDCILAEAKSILQQAREDPACEDLRAGLPEMVKAALRFGSTTEEAQRKVWKALGSQADVDLQWFGDMVHYLIDDVAHGRWQ